MTRLIYLLIGLSWGLLAVSCAAQLDVATGSIPALDSTPPPVVATNPVGEATVATNLGEISIQSDETIDATESTGALTCDGVSITTGAPTFNESDLSLRATIDEPLPEGAACQINWIVQDTSDNVTTTTITFTVASGAAASDTTKPAVSSTAPGDGTTDVSTTLTQLTFLFSEGMDSTRCSTGNLSCTPSISFNSCSYSTSDNGCRCVLSGSLSANTSFECILSNQEDTTGNDLGGYTLSFSSGSAPDTTPPTIVQTFPANGDTGISILENIYVCFSETIGADQCLTANATFSPDAWGGTSFSTCCVTGTDGCSTKDPTCSDTEFEWKLDTGSGVTWNVKGNVPLYTITIQNIKDASGNTMTTTSFSWEPQP